jgi:hypothetical protein
VSEQPDYRWLIGHLGEADEDTDVDLICPLKLVNWNNPNPAATLSCHREDCAWWHPTRMKCIIWALEQLPSITIGLVRIKEILAEMEKNAIP